LIVLTEQSVCTILASSNQHTEATKMTTKRTDKFRPSVIDPTLFVFIGMTYHGSSENFPWDELGADMDAYDAHKAQTGGVDASHGWPGRCDCCGSRFLFGGKFYAASLNTYIEIGHICGRKLNLGDPAAFKNFREQVNTYKIHKERIAKARAFTDTHGLTAALEMYLDKNNRSMEFPERTLRDMMGKLVQWGGDMSEKQIAFAAKLLAQIADRPRLEAEKAERDANKLPVPIVDKRITVEGLIISTREDEGCWTDTGFYRNACTKMLVEHVDGWRVWGTMPSGLSAKKGDRVRFNARLERSNKDPLFGFFARATKPELVVAIEQVAA
jgi:hypothetical protein